MKKMLLSEIAEMLRNDLDEETIVRMIKNREIKEIEKNGYTTQHNYPNGVYVHASGEDLDGIMFGYRNDAEKLRKNRVSAGLDMKEAAELSAPITYLAGLGNRQ